MEKVRGFEAVSEMFDRVDWRAVFLASAIGAAVACFMRDVHDPAIVGLTVSIALASLAVALLVPKGRFKRTAEIMVAVTIGGIALGVLGASVAEWLFFDLRDDVVFYDGFRLQYGLWGGGSFLALVVAQGFALGVNARTPAGGLT